MLQIFTKLINGLALGHKSLTSSLEEYRIHLFILIYKGAKLYDSNDIFYCIYAICEYVFFLFTNGNTTDVRSDKRNLAPSFKVSNFEEKMKKK